MQLWRNAWHFTGSPWLTYFLLSTNILSEYQALTFQLERSINDIYNRLLLCWKPRIETASFLFAIPYIFPNPPLLELQPSSFSSFFFFFFNASQLAWPLILHPPDSPYLRRQVIIPVSPPHLKGEYRPRRMSFTNQTPLLWTCVSSGLIKNTHVPMCHLKKSISHLFKNTLH